MWMEICVFLLKYVTVDAPLDYVQYETKVKNKVKWRHAVERVQAVVQPQ